MAAGAVWRDDLDALQFQAGDGANCMIHRLAFRRLVGFAPEAADCLTFFNDNAVAFQAAATDKASRENLAPGRNFHLTSRDVRRHLQG
jgi:hypothetical protein